jgi:hypothetical protein
MDTIEQKKSKFYKINYHFLSYFYTFEVKK